jgi:DNA-directed RNA polymerase subunit RPC12/RpoP
MPKCSRCGSGVFGRVQRMGFLQMHILPFFHLYPWRCVICGKLVFWSARSERDLR